MFLVTADEMRAFDAAAINDYGIPGVVLMENAGRTTFQILNSFFDDDVRELSVSVVAGAGNNGGDGYVIARYLLNHGADVKTFLLSPREKIKGDALINLEVLEKMTSDVFVVQGSELLEEAAHIWQECDVIVDAVLGTGLSSDVRSPFLEAIEKMNQSPAFKLSVDIPSGLDANTGNVLGIAVEADITATYGFPKRGMALYPGVDYCGQIEVVDISIPRPVILNGPPGAELYEVPDDLPFFRIRTDAEAHKGTFGHVLVIGGSAGKTGAPAMAARAAARMGAGLVTVGVPASLNDILEVKLTEEMTEPLPESMPGYLGTECIDRVLALAEGKDCVLLGPGLSTRESIPQLAETVIAEYPGRLVIDADGLNCIAQNTDMLKKKKGIVTLTPHPGEMARLLGISPKEVQDDRIGCAVRTAAEYGVHVILKGARTLTVSPDGYITVNPSGNPWMANGGQGDVLTGVLGGLLAQGIEPDDALPFGVFIHGHAADRIVDKRGSAPVTAGDVLEELSDVIRELASQDVLE
jgi:NAD(P)H-hydrate epimerase